MYKNYIFDLYGTLIDINTNEGNTRVWEHMKELFGFYKAFYTPSELKDEYEKTIHQMEQNMKEYDYPEVKVEYVFQELFNKKEIQIDIEKCKEFCEFFRIITTDYIKVYDGVFSFLNLLKQNNKKIYLLSNAQRSFTEKELIYTGLYDYFDGICISSEESCKKPSVKFFDSLFKRYHLNKSESIMIGNDSTSDIEGANKYGIDSLYIHTNISPQDTNLNNIQAKYVVKDGNFCKISKQILICK